MHQRQLWPPLSPPEDCVVDGIAKCQRCLLMLNFLISGRVACLHLTRTPRIFNFPKFETSMFGSSMRPTTGWGDAPASALTATSPCIWRIALRRWWDCRMPTPPPHIDFFPNFCHRGHHCCFHHCECCRLSLPVDCCFCHVVVFCCQLIHVSASVGGHCDTASVSCCDSCCQCRCHCHIILLPQLHCALCDAG